MIGIIYAALLAVGQNDLKRLVSYTSIAHFGFIGIGIFAFTTQAGTGAVLYMVNHGLATGLLFLVVGMFVARRGSALVSDFGGAGKLVPVLAGVLFFAGLASLALPGTAPFVSEFLVLIGTFTVQQDGRGDRHRRHHPGRRVRALDGAADHAGHAQPGADRGAGDAAGTSACARRSSSRR